MKNSKTSQHIQELLAEQALFGLDEAEQAGLHCLLHNNPTAEADVFEKIAASLASTPVENGPSESGKSPLPISLSEKLLAHGKQIAIENRTAPVKAQQTVVSASSSTEVRPAVPGKSEVNYLTYLGWIVAAGLLAFVTFRPTTAGPKPVTPPALSQQYDDLVSAGAKSWEQPVNTQKVSGQICWHEARQKGFMKLSNLPVNDPKEKQYQLWIFDEQRDKWEKLPVDGGVFNIATQGEVIVPIENKLKVNKPVMWAITVEAPGGVVVSDRKEIVFLAKST